MAIFDTFGISGSGLMTHRKWLDAVSDNIANINNVTSTDQDAFQERLIVAQAVDYGSGEGGVRVARAEYGDADTALAGAVVDGLGDDEPLLERVLVGSRDRVDVRDVVRDRVHPFAVDEQPRARDAECVEDAHVTAS